MSQQVYLRIASAFRLTPVRAASLMYVDSNIASPPAVMAGPLLRAYLRIRCLATVGNALVTSSNENGGCGREDGRVSEVIVLKPVGSHEIMPTQAVAPSRPVRR